MITLTIDTTDVHSTTVSLDRDGNVLEKHSDSRVLRSQMVLPLIESIVEELQVNLNDIDEIRVCEGPGSFTGVRVGISVANTLSFLYAKPVNGTQKLAKAIY